MNRRLTPVNELDRRLAELLKATTALPEFSYQSAKARGVRSSSMDIALGGILSSFDDQLEGLRLEASLLLSEDSPFTQRRRLKEEERAQRLAEARALAEAQFERLKRERELEEMRQERLTRRERASLSATTTESIPTSSPSSEIEVDWDASVEYTVVSANDSEGPSSLIITPDDSIFADFPSDSPLRHTSPIEELKQSIPPRPVAQVTSPPLTQSLSTHTANSQQLVSLLKGLLPAKSRSQQAISQYVGSGWKLDELINPSHSQPWSIKHEVVWRELDEERILRELEGLTSLSLAPRAFSPAQPLPRRTISLRLKSTDDEQPINSLERSEEEFNLSDFEESRDPEFREMHETYRALEERVEDFNFQGISDSISVDRLEPSLDSPIASHDQQSIDDYSQDETDFATLDPDLPLVNDPFDVLDDLSFDQDQLTSDFDWEGDTPTNVFGDEPTPTNVFGDESQPGEVERPQDEMEHHSTNRGLFSRFFGRK